MHEEDRSLISLVGVGHSLVHTYELSLPILVAVWIAEFGVTHAELGIILMVGYGLFGAGALPTGVLVDSIGAKRMIVYCLAGMGGSFILLGFTTGIVSLTAAIIVWGLAASIYHPAGLTLISTTAVERGKVFAYHGMAGNLGIGLGPLVTALLLVVLDWRIAMMLLAIPALLATVFAATLSFDRSRSVTDGGEPVEPPEDNGILDNTRLLFAGAFVGIFLIVIINGLYYRGVLTFLPDILSGFAGFEPITVGEYELAPGEYFYVAMLMIGMLGQYIGGRLSDRIRPERGIIGVFATLAVLALIFVPIATTHLVVFLGVGLLLGVFLFMIQPLYQAAVANHTPRTSRGLSYGFTYLGVFGIGAAGSAVAGVALSVADPSVLFVILAIIAATGAVLATAIVWKFPPGRSSS